MMGTARDPIPLPWKDWAVGDSLIGRSRGMRGGCRKFLVIKANFKNKKQAKAIAGKVILLSSMRSGNRIDMAGKIIQITLSSNSKIGGGYFKGMKAFGIEVDEMEYE